MNALTKIKPDKKDYVFLSFDDYEDLTDIVNYHEFQHKPAAGEEEFFPSELP